MIRLSAATKRFGQTVAVDSLTLSVDAGQVVALLGPNGSGKTTTLKMTAGLVKPDSGSVALGEPPMEAWNPEARRILSFLPQRVAFPEALTGREVVDFYRRLRGVAPSRADEVLRFASLNGAGERAVATYSGGMLQRLGLAVTMLPDAAILLLDEPTAALDPEGLCAFYGLINDRRAQGRTILFTSHQVNDVDLADRVVVMAKGRVSAEFDRARLQAWRDAHGRMTVRLEDGRDIRVRGSAIDRAAALERLRASGAAIVGLTSEDGRLEGLYAELIGAAKESHA